MSEQRLVTGYFEREAGVWDGIYEGRPDVYAGIHRHRLALTLDWVDGLGLAAGCRVLEIGCGAGFATLELARRRLQVVSVDAAPAMLGLARERAQRAGQKVAVARADTQRLGLAGGRFRLVVALGVLPWLPDPRSALGEMHRVLAPGGWLIANVDNPARLNRLLDPLRNPLLVAAGRLAQARLLGPAGQPRARFDSRRRFGRLLVGAGFEVLRTVSFGFGPFTLVNRKVLPDRLGSRVDRALTGGAERGVPLLRGLGAQHLALARRPGAPG